MTPCQISAGEAQPVSQRGIVCTGSYITSDHMTTPVSAADGGGGGGGGGVEKAQISSLSINLSCIE